MKKNLSAIPVSQSDIEAARLNNQIILVGQNIHFISEDSIVFLEYAESNGGEFMIMDRDNRPESGPINSPLNLVASPMRLNNGVVFNGDMTFVKIFIISIG